MDQLGLLTLGPLQLESISIKPDGNEFLATYNITGQDGLYLDGATVISLLTGTTGILLVHLIQSTTATLLG